MISREVKISVIMPAYNVAAYVGEAIQSVLAQSGVVFELLVGDDASTDETWKRIQDFSLRPQVRCWHFGVHRGAAFISNALCQKARGSYLAFCDADDLLLPGHLKKMACLLDRESSVGVVYGDMFKQNIAGKRLVLRRSLGPTHGWDLIDGSVANGGTMVRRIIFKKVGGFRNELPFLEDCDLFLRLAEITRFRYFKGSPSYVYRERPGALSNQPKEKWAVIGRKILKDAIARRYHVQVRW